MNWTTIRILRFLLIVSAAAAPWTLLPRAALAQDAAATWSCEPERDRVVIQYIASLASAEPSAKERDLVIFYSLLNLARDRVTVTSTRSTTYTCKLKGATITATLGPGVPNVNLLGRCGAEITGVVSIQRDDRSILEDEPFENLNCHERERRIDTITIRGDGSKPDVRYVSY
jgi:hypothetical protein